MKLTKGKKRAKFSHKLQISGTYFASTVAEVVNVVLYYFNT